MDDSTVAGGLEGGAEAVTDVGRMTIEVWSDVVCPWCYLGVTYLRRALEGFEQAGLVDVIYRSFQLDPDAPLHDGVPLVTRLARKYATTEAVIEESQQRLTGLGADAGLEFRFEMTTRGNTFDAHRLIHLAAVVGLGAETKDRLFRAYFTDGLVVGDHDVLRQVAGEVGLPAGSVDKMLAGDRFAQQVRNDLARARQLGVSGVPFILIDGELALPGAQPIERMGRVLRTVWSGRHQPKEG